MTLPQQFTPFEIINIGSNLLINGKVPIAVESSPALLVGSGPQPRLWLAVPDKGSTMRYLVEDNESHSKRIKVLAKDQTVSVYCDSIPILHAVKENDKKVNVIHIDLTPIGLAIQGDLNMLRVGKSQLSGNVFENVETMINLSSQPAEASAKTSTP